MGGLDLRRPCFSCDRRDLKLEACDICGQKICTPCWVLHTEYDHKEKKKAPKKEEEDN